MPAGQRSPQLELQLTLPEKLTMTADEQRSILTIGMLAVFADGDKDERERQELRRIAESLADAAHAPSLSRIYQDVLLKRVSLTEAVALTGLRVSGLCLRRRRSAKSGGTRLPCSAEIWYLLCHRRARAPGIDAER